MSVRPRAATDCRLSVNYAHDQVGVGCFPGDLGKELFGALCKLGASPEGVLQNSFLKNGRYHDQLLWAIVESEWREDREAESVQDR